MDVRLLCLLLCMKRILRLVGHSFREVLTTVCEFF